MDHSECQRCREHHKYTPATTVHHVNYVRKHPDMALEIWYEWHTQVLNPVLKVKNDILRKYGEKDEKGKIVMDEDGRIRITDIPGYNTEITTLMNTETDVNVERFSEEEFKKMNATPNQLMTLLEIAK